MVILWICPVNSYPSYLGNFSLASLDCSRTLSAVPVSPIVLAALNLMILDYQRALLLLQPVICVQLLNIGNWEIGLEVHCLVEVNNGCIDLVDEQVHLWQKMNWTKNTEILDALAQPGLCDGRCQHCQDQVPQRRQSQQNSAGDPCLGPAVVILVERCFEGICCYTITFQGCSMDILHLALLNK